LENFAELKEATPENVADRIFVKRRTAEIHSRTVEFCGLEVGAAVELYKAEVCAVVKICITKANLVRKLCRAEVGRL
jgi:hypothetical protein